MKILERQFPSAKQKPPTEEQKNVVYQIPCQDCSWRRYQGSSLSMVSGIFLFRLCIHRRNRKIPEDEKVRTRKECETKQEGVECRETRMDSRPCN